MTTDLPDDAHRGWSAATSDVLAAHSDPPPGRRAPWLLVAAAAAMVLALVGGVTYAVGALSGGGQQAADALPAGAFGLVSVDLDPPAGQKIDGFRFLRKFPSLRQHVPLDGDVREVVFDAIADEAGWDGIDFDQDVAPWLGKRLAVATYPATGKTTDPVVVVALQVTDTGKADAGLTQLSRAARAGASGSAPVGWAFSGDYALVAESAAAAQGLAAKAAESPLAADAHFAADTADVGDGVVLAWADLGRVGDALATAAPVPGLLGGAAGSGRTTVLARFDGPDVFEVTGTTTGVPGAGWAGHQVRGMGDLPDSTAVAFGLADGDALARTAWAAVGGVLGVTGASGPELEDALGLSMPDDLATLLGTNLLLALDGGPSGELQLGARITTDAAAAGKVLDTIEAGSSGLLVPQFSLERRTVGDDLVVAVTEEQADRLAAGGAGGSLGDLPAFRSALPDLDDAALALWVDPTGVQSALGMGSDEPDADLAPLEGIGVTVTSSTPGAAAFRVRLVAH